MMRIMLNGQHRDVPVTSSVADIVTLLTGETVTPEGYATSGQPLGFAVAINNAIVSRMQWGSHTLSENDTVEVITAMQGG